MGLEENQWGGFARRYSSDVATWFLCVKEPLAVHWTTAGFVLPVTLGERVGSVTFVVLWYTASWSGLALVAKTTECCFAQTVSRLSVGGAIMSMPNENQLFCSMPFRFIEVSGWCPPKGDVFICCPNWLRVPIGNILQCHSFEEIWNGEKAREIRRSILDRSFEYCDHSMCPPLQTISWPVERIA